MADSDTVMENNDNRPIAVRRNRRTSSLLRNVLEVNTMAVASNRGSRATPPSTPKRANKRVRFSDPGPSVDSSFSSGLTPYMRRTSLKSVPGHNRRHSMPAALRTVPEEPSPFSGELQFAPLRQVLQGRVKRRLKRHRLSEELHFIESEKRREVRARRSELERLKRELAMRDAEMERMRDDYEIATQLGEDTGSFVSMDEDLTAKVADLEREISILRVKLHNQEHDDDATISDPNWMSAASESFKDDNDDDDHEEFMMTFEDFPTHMDDEMIASTPDHLRATSIPSPPSSMPATPCKTTAMSSAGVQVTLSVPDPNADSLKAQLKELQSQIKELNATLELNEDNRTRLAMKLSEFISDKGNNDHSTLDHAINTVLTQMALSQSQAVEHSARFSALTAEIATLGFQSGNSDPEKIIETIAAQFRKARLDLEYLTPGEVAEGFENEKLLDLLIGRIKTLLKRVSEQDVSIDEYHEQEVSLRKQLGARVDAFNDLQKELEFANSLIDGLREEVGEKEVGNERLTSALEGYRNEVANLEKLIRTMEKESQQTEVRLLDELKKTGDKLQDEILARETTKADIEGKDILIEELERRLAAALNSQSLEQQSTYEKRISELKSQSLEQEKAHAAALAQRDAQVTDLKTEIGLVNEALKTAHDSIQTLKKETEQLRGDVQREKVKGMQVVRTMRDQLSMVLATGSGYLEDNTTAILQQQSPETFDEDYGSESGSSVAQRGQFLDGRLARKSSVKRRRYDSGLGFLDEEEDEMLEA
ncbi:hypothetical protein F5884DRAFT_657512 [Xylogone sp. PMI_703]|nr:hypothetical protein F5884DRAFT_657512 [Xylogone sp. PMI_703]